MREGVLGVARQHAGEVRGVFGLLVLHAQRLGELIGRAGVIRVEGERLPGGLLGERPLFHLQVRLRLGGVGVGIVGIEPQGHAGGVEGFLGPLERAENEAAQHVMLRFVRLDGDGPLDGLQRLLAQLIHAPLAAGELVQGKGVVRLLRKRFLERAGGIRETAQLLELQATQDLWMRNPGAHFRMPRKVRTSS
ncbi:MAG: hypothetical protein WDN28_13515 [Chthoniobacter sp.]